MKGFTLKAFLAAFFLFSIANTSHAELNSWSVMSGDVNKINNIAGGKASENVYAGTYDGVYRYISAENRWEPFGLQNENIFHVAVNKDLYASGSANLWRYDIQNKQWDKVVLPALVEGEVIRSLSKDGDTLMLGTNKGRVFVFQGFDDNAGWKWDMYDFKDGTIVVNAIHQYDSKILVIGTNKGLYAAIVGQSHPPMAIGGNILPRDNVRGLIVFNGALFVAYKAEVYTRASDQSNFVKLSDGLEFSVKEGITALQKYQDKLYLVIRGGSGNPSRLYYLEASTWKQFSPSLSDTGSDSKAVVYLTSTSTSLYAGSFYQVSEIHLAAQPDPTPPVPTPPTDTDGDGVIDTSDNCPNAANADQANADNDNLGNACDSDFVQNEPPPSEGKSSGCSLSIFSTPGTSLLSWLTFLPLMLLGLGRLFYFRKK